MRERERDRERGEGGRGSESAFCLLLEKVLKEETEEMLLKKAERNRKRRIQAIKRREKHKVGAMFSRIM